MKHYIDKDAVVAAIKKRLLPAIIDKHYDEWEEGQDSERIAILGILDTLEVKEVDSNDAFIEKVINFLNYKLDDVVATRVGGHNNTTSCCETRGN